MKNIDIMCPDCGKIYVQKMMDGGQESHEMTCDCGRHLTERDTIPFSIYCHVQEDYCQAHHVPCFAPPSGRYLS